jgi:hypothetical protein
MDKAISTSKLFTATHAALCAGKFAEARALLDEMGQRSDNRDLLASAASYRVPAHIAQIIQDRIDQVNSKAA